MRIESTLYCDDKEHIISSHKKNATLSNGVLEYYKP